MTQPQQPTPDDSAFDGIVAQLREPVHLDGFVEARTMLTELSFVERFIIQHQDEIMYVPNVGWYTYRSGMWRLDDMDDVLELTKRLGPQLQAERFPIGGGESPLAAYGENEFASAMRGIGRLATRRSIVAGAAADSRLKVHPTSLNPDPWGLNLRDGFLDLANGGTRPWRPEDRCTAMMNATWDDDADCPRFSALLEHAFGGDREMIEFMWRSLGYCLTGAVSAQVFFFLWGIRGSSKTTIAEVMIGLMGGYAQWLNEKALVGTEDQHSTWVVDLIGKRLVVKDELSRTRKINTGRLNAFVSGTTQRANKMKRDEVDVPITCKIMITTNPRPPMGNSQDGVWRRILPVEFRYAIAKEEVIPNYSQTLITEEGSGILRRAVEALWRALEDGDGVVKSKSLRAPGSVAAGAEEYADLEDDHAAFFEDVLEVGRNDDWISNADLTSIFKTWCESNNVKPLVPSEFGKAMTSRHFKRAEPRKCVQHALAGGKKQAQRGYWGVRIVGEWVAIWQPITDLE